MNEETIPDGNYSKEAVTISPIWANIFAIIVFIVSTVIFGTIYALIWSRYFGQKISPMFGGHSSAKTLFLIFCICGIVIHELIHGLFFSLYAKNGFKSVKFGIMPMKRLFTPYCHCSEPLKVRHYLVAAIMPLVILGIIPSIISLIIGSKAVLFFGIIFIAGACGDLLMCNKLIKENFDDWIFDNPSAIGYYIYRKRNP